MKLTDTLGQFEQLIMTAITLLGDDAYGMQIYSKVCELADRDMNLGSMYVTLERLTKKGYVSSRVAEGRPEHGSKPRKFFSILPAGAQALRESVETATRISDSFWRLPKWKPFRPKVQPIKGK